MTTFRDNRAFRWLVAALLVPLLIVGGPGSPVALALTAHDAAKPAGAVGHQYPIATSAASLPLAVPTGTDGSERPEPDGISLATRPARVVIVEKGTTVDGAHLIDGNAKTTFRPESGGAVRVIVEFSRPLWLDGLSLHGDAPGQLDLVTKDGARHVERAETATSDWRSYRFEHPLWGQTFHFDWMPGALELPSEWAFWQRGSRRELGLGATPENLLPLGSFPGGSEHAAWPQTITVAHGALGREASASFHVDIPNANAASRAYLVYELEGASHFTQVKRALNGLAPLGGARSTADQGVGLQVEEIPVAALRAGENRIEFYPASPLVTPAYEVKNLRVVTLAAGSVLTSLPFTLGEHGFSRTAEREFGGVTGPEEVSFLLKHRTRGTLSLRTSAKDAYAIDLSGLKAGWHTLRVRSKLRPAATLTAALDREVEAGSLTEVIVSGLGLPRESSGEIVLSYPLLGECFAGEATVRGFVQGVDRPRLTVQGKPVDVLRDGSFQLTTAGPADTDWTLTLEAEGVTGERALLRRSMQPCLPAVQESLTAEQVIEDEGAPFAQVVTSAGGTLSFAGARLDIPPGALAEPTRITIRPLPRSVVPQMNPGMTNVTPLGQAYRFGPHGLNFEAPVRLSLPYEETAIPPAAGAGHVAGYFYDEDRARWVQVGRADEASAGRHASFTHHFTDFVNATIATPDAPGASAFAQTGMSGVGAGDPLAGVTSMAPPAANPFGNAVTSLPIELPPGRNGMTPSLALTYDSSQGSSWVGYGWRLSGLSKIELDTRFGVPDYDNQFAQKVGKLKYALDGEQLTLVSSVPGGAVYRRRVEGSFQHILQVPASDGTGATYFEVTAQDGTKYTYGKTDAAREFDPAAPSHVSAWHLESVVDVSGNKVNYIYQRTEKSLNELPCTEEGAVCAYGILPLKIEYTTHTTAGYFHYYRVEFFPSAADRGDERVSGRAGFLTYEGRLLRAIRIALVTPQGVDYFRTYNLRFEEGAFGKHMLARVEQARPVQESYDVLAEHKFSYSKMYEVPSADAESQVHTWVDAYEAEQEIASSPDQASYSLGQRNGWNVSMSTGVSLFLFSSDFLSVGVSINGTVGSTWGNHSFFDVSGDGLPDYLNAYGQAHLGQYQHGNYGLDLRGLPQPYLPVDYDAGYDNDTMLPLTVTAGLGVEAGAQAVDVEASGQVGLSVAMDFRTFADMDGDGFPDRVEVVNGEVRVYRNQGSKTGSQTFGNGSYEIWDNMDPLDYTIGDDRLGQLETETSQTDPLVRWVAPRPGTVRIGGAVQRVAGGLFGAQTTIYKESDVLWSRPISAADTNTCAPSGTSGCGGAQLQAQVAAGDSLYFRLHPRAGYAKSDPVQWQPTIVYADADAAMLAQVEPYGRPVDQFSLVSDFRTGSGVSMPFSVPLTGEAVLGGTLTKTQTPDHLYARIYSVTVNGGTPQRTLLKEWPISPIANPAGADLSVSTDDPTLPLDELEAGTMLEFQLSSDTPIDPTQVTWEPFVSFYQAMVPDPFPGRSDLHGAVSCVAPIPPSTQPTCSVSNGVRSVPVPHATVRKRAPVSFLQPFSAPNVRTEQFHAVGGDLVLEGNLTVPFAKYGRTVGICQTTNRILWKEERLAPGSTTVAAVIQNLSAGDPVTCSLRTEADLNGTWLSLNATSGADQTSVPINRRSELAPGFSPHQYDHLRVLSGQFHGWSFGDWDAARPFDADKIKEDGLREEHPAFFPATPGKQGGAGSPDAWHGRGGAFIAATGLLQPGVVSTSDALDGGEHGDGSVAARISHSFTYGGTVTTPFHSIGFAESHYVQDREMLDMNGDRMADNVTAFGVSYSTGCLDVNGECEGAFTGNNAAMRTTATETWTKITKTRVGLNIMDNGGKVTLVRPARDGVPQAVSSLGIGLGSDHASTVTQQELLDMNGDGLPDLVKWDEGTGQLSVWLNLGYRYMPDLDDPPILWAQHATPHPWRRGLYPQALVEEGEEFEGERDNIDTFMGIGTGNGGVQTALAHSEVTTLTPSVGGGVEIDPGPVALSAGGGAAYQHSIRRDLGRFVDVTGDGLLDYVVARGPIGVVKLDPDTGAVIEISNAWLHVFPNLGTTFGARQMWHVPDWYATSTDEVGEYFDALNFAGPDFDQDPLSALSVSRSSDWTIFESGQICFLFVCAYVASNQAMVEEQSLVELQDVNGDGLPDFVMKDRGSYTTRAKLNKLGGINLLTGIEGPAGRTITLHYGTEGATHDQPGASFVLKQVDVEDGQGGKYVSQYEYLATGNTSRSEREFLGYRTVNEYRPNDSCVQTTYENGDFYRKGLPTKRTVNTGCPGVPADAVEGTLLEETFDYNPPVDVPPGGTHHPFERVRTRALLEGQATGPTTTETKTWSPTHGNLTSLVITGDEVQKDLTYSIEYVAPGPNIVRPSRVRAIGNGVTWRDRRATYDSSGRLLTVANYNATGALLLSQTSVTSRDVYGNPRTIVDPNSGMTTYEYDNVLHTYVGKLTDPHGIVSTASYNTRLGVPTSVVNGNGGTQTYTYDGFGRLTSFTGPLDQGSDVPTVVYEYSPIRLPGQNFENNPVWVKARHKDVSRNLPTTSLSDHDFIEVVSFADGLGRTIQTKKDLARDDGGELEVGMTVSGKVVFDDQGRPVQVGQPLFSTAPVTTFVVQTAPINPSEFDYDDLDRVVRRSTPLDDTPNAFVSVQTSFGHELPDGGGQLKHATYIDTSDYTGPIKMPRRILRDADGQIAEIQEYNHLGSNSAATLLVTRYETNPMNELQVVTDPAGNQTTTLYNALGLVREMTSPDMGRVVWTYRPDGNVATKETAQLRAKGEIITYLYDLDRLIGVDFANPNSTDIVIEYGDASEQGDGNGNLAGRIKSETSEAGTRTFRYDALGQVIEESTTFDRKGVQNGPDYTVSMQYKHDPFGRLLETRFLGPDRELVSYGYDEGGNLQSVFGQRLGFNPDALSRPHHTTYLAHRGYDEFGQLVTEVAGNLTPTTYTYGPRSRRLIHLDRGHGFPLNGSSYEYDSVGNIVSIDNQAVSFTLADGIEVPSTQVDFTYDNLDQLRTASGLGHVVVEGYSYALEQQYDALGNIVSKDQASFTGDTYPPTTPVPSQTYANAYTYAAPVKHAPSRVQGNGVTTDYQYDASGNRTRSTTLTETKEYTWTEDDLLRSVKRSNDNYDLVRNYYDASAQKRISLHPGATATEEVAYASNMTLRSEGNARYVTKHIYAGTQRLASKMDARWFAEDNVQYYATDHLGSTNFTFDSEQNLISHTEYFPSGEVWRSETAPAYQGLNPYSFTGKEWDATTGLYDFGARQYDPRLGQWLSPDPAFDGLNLYAYVHNNPVNMVDPLGLSAEYGRDNPIPVNVEGVPEGKTFAWGSGSETGDYSAESFDRMTSDRPVLQQSRTGLTPEMGDAIGRMGEEARAAVEGLENGGLGPMDTALQAGMMAGAAASGSDIRTDGTGSAMGIPGGQCTSCSGGRAWQAAFIGLTIGATIAGSAWSGYAALGAARAAHIARLQLYHNVDDYLADAGRVAGFRPADLMLRLGDAPDGWQIEALRKGAHKGQGWVLREYGAKGGATGRMLRFHPGGGHHGPAAYWRVVGYNGSSGVIR